MMWLKPSKCVEKSNWHFWFAWYPITVKFFPDETCEKIWLKIVLRKGTFNNTILAQYWTYQYKHTTQ